MLRSRISTWSVLAVLAWGGSAVCKAEELKRFEFVETHMGSPYQVVLYTTDEAAASQASRAAYQRIAALDLACSDYNPDSELMRFCDRAGSGPVAVSADLFDILNLSQELAGRTDGAFDITVGPVVRLWRRARRTRQLPEAETLAAALKRVGFANLRLDPAKRTAELLKPGMKLDLGGIAKGYASQEAIAVLKREGISRALVAGAGDIVVSGPPPDAEGWRIGIAPLEAPGKKKPEHYVILHDRAISTSGDAERFVEIGGKRYSHIVDPKTGVGLVDRISVTVVAPTGGLADGLDTAVCVLGVEKGLELIEATPGAAAFVMRLTDEGMRTYESKRWKELRQQTEGND